MHCRWSSAALAATTAWIPLALVEVEVMRLAIVSFDCESVYWHSMHLVCFRCLEERAVAVMVLTFLSMVCQVHMGFLVTLRRHCDDRTYSANDTTIHRTVVDSLHSRNGVDMHLASPAYNHQSVRFDSCDEFQWNRDDLVFRHILCYCMPSLDCSWPNLVYDKLHHLASMFHRDQWQFVVASHEYCVAYALYDCCACRQLHPFVVDASKLEQTNCVSIDLTLSENAENHMFTFFPLSCKNRSVSFSISCRQSSKK